MRLTVGHSVFHFCFLLLACQLFACALPYRLAKKWQLRDYGGDGAITLLRRVYVPGVAETYGYVILLPGFVPEKSLELEYDLSGIPRWGPWASVRVVFPKEYSTTDFDFWPPRKSDLPSEFPRDHWVNYQFLEKESREVITEGSVELSRTPAIYNRDARKVFSIAFEITRVELDSFANRGEILLRLHYDIGHSPYSNTVLVFIVQEAPFG